MLMSPTGITQGAGSFADLLQVLRDPEQYKEQIATLEQLAKQVDEGAAKNQRDMAEAKALRDEAKALNDKTNAAVTEAQQTKAAADAALAEAQSKEKAANEYAGDTDIKIADYEGKFKKLATDTAAFEAMRDAKTADMDARENALAKREKDVTELQERLANKLAAFNDLAKV